MEAQATKEEIEQKVADIMNALPQEIRVLAAILTQIHAALVRIEDAIRDQQRPTQ